MTLTILAITSGLLQALGYFVYVRKTLKFEVAPNPTTWFMFAYGTAILTILEWDLEASWTLLVLPVVCAVLSVSVAFLCWRRGTLKWPTHLVDRSAFLADVALTVAYVGIWAALAFSIVTEGEKGFFVVLFLVLTNLSTIISFLPLIKGAVEDPGCEHSLPWFVWSGAYFSLIILTYLEVGWESEFMIYPVLNTILHGSVGLLALRK